MFFVQMIYPFVNIFPALYLHFDLRSFQFFSPEITCLLVVYDLGWVTSGTLGRFHQNEF